MLNFLPGVFSLITRHDMLSQTNGVVIACSGGADSTCLLHHLVPLCRSRGLSILVGHMNHGLRGQESDRDEAFVHSLAASYDIPCQVTRALPAGTSSTGQSPQARYRAVRLAFLRELAVTTGYQRIALGHTLDDALETFFIRFLRGSGLSGLRGMLPVSDMIIRPLLELQHRDVVTFLESHHLPWVEDSSNNEDYYLRNKVRHCLLPHIDRSFDGDLRHIFSRTIISLRADDDYLRSSVIRIRQDQALVRSRDIGANRNLIIDRQAFSLLHEALQRRLIIDCIHETRQGYQEFPALASRVEDILETNRDERLTTNRRGIDCGDGVRIIVSQNTIVIGPTRTPPRVLLDEVELNIPGTTVWKGTAIVVHASILTRSEFETIDIRSLPANDVLFDFDLLGSPLKVRPRKPGDLFIPFGCHRNQSLKRFLTARHVTCQVKDTIPVIVSRDEIIWVAGHRRAACARVTSATKTVLRLTLSVSPPGPGSTGPVLT